MTRKPEKRPPFVIVQNDKWHVCRQFWLGEKYANGRKKYTQVKRICEPETEWRAAEIAEDLLDEFETIQRREAAPMTIARLVRRVLDAKEGSIELRTYEFYDDMDRRFVADSAIGAAALSETGTAWLQERFDELKKSGITPKVLGNLRLFLIMVFEMGRKWKKVSENPVLNVIVPTHIPKDISFFTETQARAFLAACSAHPHGLVFKFALETFTRPGEYLSLQWSAVNFEECTVRIARAVSVGLKGGGFRFKKPKTKKSIRTIDISTSLRDALVAHREKQLTEIAERKKKSRGANHERRLRARRVADEEIRNHATHNLVFPASNGMPASRVNVGKRELRDVLDAAGLEDLGFHLYTLRHSGITLSLAAGADIKSVSEKAGHASVSFTLDTYGHVLPSMRREATEKLASMLYDSV